MVYPIAKRILIPFINLWIKKVNRVENLKKTKTFIVACNHTSYFDDLAVPGTVVCCINKKIHMYVNSRFFKNYFLRRFLYWGGSIPVSVEKSKYSKEINKRAFQTALKFLKEGDIVGIFPEGHRSVDGRLQRAKLGVAKLALHAKVPVIPIGIDGSEKVLPKGSFFPRPKRCVTINIGKPIYFDKYYSKKNDKNNLIKVANIVMKEIAKLAGKEYNFI